MADEPGIEREDEGMSHKEMFKWASAVLEGKRKRGIPGTIDALNAEVQAVLNNRALSPTERGATASGLITAKVLAAHKIGATK